MMMNKNENAKKFEKMTDKLDKKPGARKVPSSLQVSSLLQKEWTIMIYMAGDNNLSEDMITALRALKTFGGSSYVNILALYDSGYPMVPVTFYDFSKVIKPSGETRADLTSYADAEIVKDMLGTKPTTHSTSTLESVPIEKFVPWVLKQRRYRANKYALILSGHSDAVIGKTILRDDNPSKALNLRELTRELGVCRQYLPKRSDSSKKSI